MKGNLIKNKENEKTNPHQLNNLNTIDEYQSNEESQEWYDEEIDYNDDKTDSETLSGSEDTNDKHQIAEEMEDFICVDESTNLDSEMEYVVSTPEVSEDEESICSTENSISEETTDGEKEEIDIETNKHKKVTFAELPRTEKKKKIEDDDITVDNVVFSKRNRKRTEHYQDENFTNLMFSDVPEEEIKFIMNDTDPYFKKRFIDNGLGISSSDEESESESEGYSEDGKYSEGYSETDSKEESNSKEKETFNFESSGNSETETIDSEAETIDSEAETIDSEPETIDSEKCEPKTEIDFDTISPNETLYDSDEEPPKKKRKIENNQSKTIVTFFIPQKMKNEKKLLNEIIKNDQKKVGTKSTTNEKIDKTSSKNNNHIFFKHDNLANGFNERFDKLE